MAKPCFRLRAMRVPLDREFHRQRRQLNFKFCCEDCGHFDRRQGCCAHGWPTQLHRTARYDDPACSDIVFCKEFELL